MRKIFWFCAYVSIIGFSLVVLACSASNDTGASSSKPSEQKLDLPTETSPSTSSTPTPTKTRASIFKDSRDPDRKAPEFVGLDGWLNSDPFKLEDKLGQVVLIDFWTYTCVNCIRTLPHIKDWHDKYGDKGLVILGIHAPEFEFEKIPANVSMARNDHGLKYPIAQDNDLQTWKAFENQFWPAKYLIDKDGWIRFSHFGEGAYIETENQIRRLLIEAGSDIESVEISSDPEPARDDRAWKQSDPFEAQTRELYAGFLRNAGALRAGYPPYVLNKEFYSVPGQTLMYEDPGDHKNHHIYLQGEWLNGPEELIHSRETENYEDYLAINFKAIEVNVVLSIKDQPYNVRVLIDGRPLALDEAGTHISFDDQGNSFVAVGASDMYHIVQLPEYSNHELQLTSNSDQLSIYAFTFGSYLSPQP